MTPKEQRQMRHYELNAIEKDRKIAELSNENERLKREIQGVLDYMPRDARIDAREGLCASLAISVAKLSKLRDDECDSLRSDLVRSDGFRERLAMKHRRLNDSHSRLTQLYNQQLEITERVCSLLVQAVGLITRCKDVTELVETHATDEIEWIQSAMELHKSASNFLALPQIAEMKEGKA